MTAGATVQNFSDQQMDEYLGVVTKTLQREQDAGGAEVPA